MARRTLIPLFLALSLLTTTLPVNAFHRAQQELSLPLVVAAYLPEFRELQEGDPCHLENRSREPVPLRVKTAESNIRKTLGVGKVVSAADPMAAESTACVFELQLQIPGAKQYRFFIGATEIYTTRHTTLAEIDDQALLAFTVDSSGVFSGTEKDIIPYAGHLEVGRTPTDASPDTSGSSSEILTAKVNVLLFVYDDLSVETVGGCGLAEEFEEARLIAKSRPGSYTLQRTLRHNGKLVSADQSPFDAVGCLYELTLELKGADAYTFQIGGVTLATVPFAELTERQEPLLLAIDRFGSRTPIVGSIVVPTPVPTPAPTPTPIPPTPMPEAGERNNGKYLVVGTLVLQTDSVLNTAFGCSGTGGYDDISAGTQIVARDGNGNILGVGRLEDTDMSSDFGCSYVFFAEVPESEFYVFTLSHRGELIYTFEEMEEAGWEIYLTLGG